MQHKDLYIGKEKTFTQFSGQSFAWKYIESLALDRHLSRYYNNEEMSVLEAGCGNGRIVAHFISKGFPQQNIVGLDQNEQPEKIF